MYLQIDERNFREVFHQYYDRIYTGFFKKTASHLATIRDIESIVSRLRTDRLHDHVDSYESEKICSVCGDSRCCHGWDHLLGRLSTNHAKLSTQGGIRIGYTRRHCDAANGNCLCRYFRPMGATVPHRWSTCGCMW